MVKTASKSREAEDAAFRKRAAGVADANAAKEAEAKAAKEAEKRAKAEAEKPIDEGAVLSEYISVLIQQARFLYALIEQCKRIAPDKGGDIDGLKERFAKRQLDHKTLNVELRKVVGRDEMREAFKVVVPSMDELRTELRQGSLVPAHERQFSILS